MTKKTWQEKLKDSKGLPKIEKITEKGMERWGGKMGDKFVIPAPIEVYEIMNKVPKGKLVTIAEIRKVLAKKHNVAMACPLTTGIFFWVAANAAFEEKNKMPYFRTLKTGGEINPKYPGGIEAQKKLLEGEGHKIIQRGKKYFVADFDKKLVKL